MKKPKNLPPINAAAEYKIRIADPETLKPYDKNPRLISQAAIDKVLASVREFGWQQPIVVDEDGVIIVGHTRRLAAIKGGYKSVPVHDALGLTKAQKNAYRLADNRTGEESEWDLPVLGAEIAALRLDGFDLGPLGFDLPELRALEAKEPGKDPEATPEPPAKLVTRAGDLWELGDHYLFCGDCTRPENVEALLDGAKPMLCVTDQPYGVEYDPEWRAGATQKGSIARHKAKTPSPSFDAKGAVENDDRADWREAWALFPGDVIYVWHASLKSPQTSLAAAGYIPKAQIIWRKQQFVIGRSHYHWQHETLLYCVRSGATAGWLGGRKQGTVWDIVTGSGFSTKSEGADARTGHSTQKPIECMKRPIENNSKPGDAVYDPFLGSGTTLIAAEMTGRRCYGLGISPAYCDVIVRRWEEFTGKKAKLAATGDSFEQTAKRRKVKAK